LSISSQITRSREALPVQNITHLYVRGSFLVYTYYGLTENGEVWTWQRAARAIIRNDAEINDIPKRVFNNTSSVFVGLNHVLALKTNDTLWVYYGYEPVQLLENVAKVSVLGDRNVALTNCGQLYAWGENICGKNSPQDYAPTIFRTENSDRNHTSFFRMTEHYY
jgi:alpha-tubulin suppressor-like RCC1 family protein